MDVVNGKIVPARTGWSSGEGWSALQQSRGLTAEGMHGNLDHLRGSGSDWVPAWATPWSFGGERALNAWGGRGTAPGHGPPSSLSLGPGAARWSQRHSVEKHHVGAFHDCSGTQPRPVSEHRQGWGGVKRHFRFGPIPQPGSETNLDEMMATFESQITQAMPGHLANECATSSLGRKTPSRSLPFESSKECSLQRPGSDAGSKHESESQSIPKSTTLVGTSSDLKRKRLEIKISDEADCGWSRPLKLVLRKGLSMSDVGDLGRIIIPKRSAESQFQQIIDTKEGTMLEMHDYNGSKRWFFRFKWWINNKSRMYVLENTGEFIKYYGLKEHDIFVVYEDNSKKKVVRGQKGTDLDSMLDGLQGTNAKSSPKKPSPTKDEGLASTTALA